MFRGIGASRILLLVCWGILNVLAGCSAKDEHFVAPVNTPEGTTYVAFEVHRNNLAITDAVFTDPSGIDFDESLVAIGLDGRGLIYPNEAFSTPLIIPSAGDFHGVYFNQEDLVLVCGGGEDGSGLLLHYDGVEWNHIPHSATGIFTAISIFYLCSDAGEVLRCFPQTASLELAYQAPPGVSFNGIFQSNTSAPIPEVIAIGDEGAIFHRYEGGAFVDESIQDGPDFIALAGYINVDVPTEALALSSHEIWLFSEGLWSRVYQNPGVILNNIYYHNQGEAIAVGDGGLILRGYGLDWTVESLGEDVDITVVAFSKAEPGGYDLCGSHGEVFRTRGSTTNLNHHASGPWSAFFTTNDGTKYAANANKLMRFDVEDWGEIANWEWGRNIIAFHVVAPDQIWAIGEMGDGVDHFVLFYNGNDWSLMNNSSLDKFNAIWCDATGENVFVAADRGQILWWNGGIWVPEVDLGTSDAFHALWGTGLENLLAVGDSGMIMRRGASGWTNETSNTSFALRAVNGPVIAGDGGTILRQSNGAWNNFGLELEVSYNGIWSGSQDQIWAVGDDASVMHFDGSEWTRLLTHLPGIDFLSVTGVDADNVWIGGSEGFLLRTPH